MRESMLPGRRAHLLQDNEVANVDYAFTALAAGEARLQHEWRNEAGAKSGFVVRGEADGQYGVIILAPDIYPGANVANPNSMLDVLAAVAHEVEHFHRWLNACELDGEGLQHLDEAFTSLQAACRHQGQLSKSQVVQLVSDALHRLNLYCHGAGVVPPGDGNVEGR